MTRPEEKAVETLYRLHEEAVGVMAAACRPGCADCCTRNVLMTRLEARYLVNHLDAGQRSLLLALIRPGLGRKRFVPKLTANGFVRVCREGKDVPEEENDPSWGPCPLLHEGLCRVYALRPLGCRVLLSGSACREKGYAQMPSVVMTINYVCQQIMEDLDPDGYTGNLTDVLVRELASGTSEARDRAGACVPNEPIPCLMVPPEHQNRLTAFIHKIVAVKQFSDGSSPADITNIPAPWQTRD